jgi:hypothetical protein
MRSVNYLIAAALVSGMSGTAMAQSSLPPPPTPVPAMAPANDAGLVQSHWTAAGFLGANFGSAASDVSLDNKSSLDFGGQVSYLWKGVVGGEFLAEFTPSFGFSSVLLPDNPHVNSYMANAIGVYPLGGRGQYQPYASGGFGDIQMRFGNTASIATNANQNTWGGNIGGGFMAFAGKVGFRADVRYYRASTSNSLSADDVTKTLLSGLSFWRSNAGIAFQW